VKLVLPWLREFADIRAEAGAVAEALALRGFEVASIEARPEPVIDFDITANRPDCLSVIGLAREAATAFEVEFKDLLASGAAPPADALPARGPGPPASRDANLEVDIEDPDLCPRYAAQVFRVKIGPSPDWIARRLHAAGVRPINTIVDATNYVMLERGHPTHAFDLERLAGRALRIRRARKGERLRTLDGVDRALEPDMLVIADAERPQAIGGVMGGADSEVTPTTATVALESAWFLPRSVRRTAKTLELRTEASMRFERGADIEGPLAAIRRVGELLAKMGAGEPIGAPIDRYPSPRLPLRLTLRRPQIARLLGADVPANDVVRILTGLGFGVRPHFERPQTPGFDESVFERSKWGLTPSDGWLVTVPSWRVDATREADLIEEIARHYGYDRLPTTFPPLDAVAAPPDPRIARDALVRQALGGAGFAEAVTFTFIERGAAEPFDPAGGLVAIANPLSETFAVIRPSLVPGLVDAAAHNRRRERRDVRLFEIGTAFSATDGESRRVGLVWTGAAAPEHWSGPGRAVDFSDMRGAVERVADALGAGVAIERAAVSWLVPGRAASIALAVGGPEPGLRVGVVGQLRPSIAEARGVPGGDDIYVAEIDLERLAAAASAHDDLRVAPLPRHPSIVRDLSILVADTLPAAAVRGTIRAAAPRLLESIAEFDRYQGQGVPDGQVSLSFHLTFRAPDRTLTDEEVDRAMAAIVAALEREHGARRR
jgi:phenylalanyl-tRNA synthetase beta chain